jgi:hypothetical protein
MIEIDVTSKMSIDDNELSNFESENEMTVTVPAITAEMGVIHCFRITPVGIVCHELDNYQNQFFILTWGDLGVNSQSARTVSGRASQMPLGSGPITLVKQVWNDYTRFDCVIAPDFYLEITQS